MRKIRKLGRPVEKTMLAPILEPREITSPHRDYQPRKAEKEEEIDMPAASRETIRRAFFRPFKLLRDRRK